MPIKLIQVSTDNDRAQRVPHEVNFPVTPGDDDSQACHEVLEWLTC